MSYLWTFILCLSAVSPGDNQDFFQKSGIDFFFKATLVRYEMWAFDTDKEVCEKKERMYEWRGLTLEIIHENSLLSKDIKNSTNWGNITLSQLCFKIKVFQDRKS